MLVTAQKLRPYFQSHYQFPVKQILRKPDLARRMMTWAVELSKYNITFVSRGAIKSKVLADFLVEFNTPLEVSSLFLWTLSIDGSSNLKGSGAGIVLEGPNEVLLE